MPTEWSSSPMFPSYQTSGAIDSTPLLHVSADACHDVDYLGTTIPTTPESYWDQFTENQRLFGTTTSFDPSLSAYTTPLILDSLTPEQIARADELSKIQLPSENLKESKCMYCQQNFENLDELVEHVMRQLEIEVDECHVGATRNLKSILKRKSWIVVQESLPHGLVSQIEGLYKRPITSSTNLQSILDCVRKESVDDDVRDYLVREVICVVLAASGVPPTSTKNKDIAQAERRGLFNKS
jgi:hypothetical protein